MSKLPLSRASTPLLVLLLACGAPRAHDVGVPAVDASQTLPGPSTDGGGLGTVDIPDARGPQPALDASVPSAHGALTLFELAGMDGSEQLYRVTADQEPLQISDTSSWEHSRVSGIATAVALDASFALYLVTTTLDFTDTGRGVHLVKLTDDGAGPPELLTPPLPEGRSIWTANMRAHERGVSVLYVTDALAPAAQAWELFWVEVDLQGRASTAVRLHAGKTSSALAPDCVLTRDGAAYFQADFGAGEQTYWVRLDANAVPVQISPSTQGLQGGRELMIYGRVSSDDRVVIQHVHDDPNNRSSTRLYATELGANGPGAPLLLAPWHQGVRSTLLDSSDDGHLIASVLADANTIGIHRFQGGAVSNASMFLPPLTGTQPGDWDLQVTPSERVVIMRGLDRESSASDVWVSDASGAQPTAPALVGSIRYGVNTDSDRLSDTLAPYRAPRSDLVPVLHVLDQSVSFALLDVRVLPGRFIDLSPPISDDRVLADHACAHSLGVCLFTFSSRDATSSELFRYDANAALPLAERVETGTPAPGASGVSVADAQQAALWQCGNDLRVLDLTTKPVAVDSLRTVAGNIHEAIALRRASVVSAPPAQ